MLILVSILCFAALWLGVLLFEPRVSWRRSILTASVAWGVLVVIVTEVLSLLNALTFVWTLVYWLLILAALSAGVALLARQRPESAPYLIERLALARDQMWKTGDAPGTRLFAVAPTAIALVGVALIVAATGLIAVVAAPNNWDSMTFHLARVMYWVEHASVNPYPTDIMRQLYEAPWAEFAVAQFYLLSGSDTFSALVQWWSMLGSALGVSLIARQLGAPRAGQVFAAVFVVTLPMGILQSTSTQNDYVTAFWFVCFVHFLLAFRRRPESWWNILGLGASLGLAMLTKATTYVYALPFLLLLAYWAIRLRRWRVWEVALVAGSVAFTLNVGYYMRNLRAFGAVFGPPDEVSHYSNTQFTGATLVANIIRDLALQIGTPSNHANAAISFAIQRVFSAMGININDPTTSWAPWAFNALSYHEDYAGNPLHFLLILAIIPLCLAFARLRRERVVLAYIAALILSFLVFALYLKWQPWSSRLELVYFALFAPICGLALARLSPRIALNLAALTLLVAATPWVVANKSRPLVGPASILETTRVDQYFANRKTLETPYVGAATYLYQQRCSTVGLVDSIDDWEYPWWALIAPVSGPVDIEHVNVQNDTTGLAGAPPYSSFQPCAIIMRSGQLPAALDYHGARYSLGWKASSIAVYIPH